MNDAWSRWRSHRADPPPPRIRRRPDPANAGGNGADTASWLASRGWGEGSSEDATTRGRPDGESWNGRGRPPGTSARSSRHGRSCLRVGADETRFGRCSRGAAPSRERTTDWNGTGTRQQVGADDRLAGSLETAARRDVEGRRRAGRALVFHPPIRHDEANRWSGQPETGARRAVAANGPPFGGTTPGTAVKDDDDPWETGGGETTRPTGVTSGMRAGMQTRSSEPARWFARRLESARSMTGRTERKSQRRQKPAFSGPRMREVARPAYARDRPRVLRRRSEESQE